MCPLVRAGALNCATPNAEHDTVIKTKKVDESELLEKNLQNKSLREKMEANRVYCHLVWLYGLNLCACIELVSKDSLKK